MTLAWKASNRRALTRCVLIAVSLLFGGCQGFTEHTFQRFVNPRVCPKCPATSIEQCNCFSAADNAGYSETTWSSLDPAMGDRPYVPSQPAHSEELPAPVIPFTPPLEDEQTSGNRSLQAPEGVQAATNWEFEAQIDAPSSNQAFSSYSDREDEPFYDYFKR